MLIYIIYLYTVYMHICLYYYIYIYYASVNGMKWDMRIIYWYNMAIICVTWYQFLIRHASPRNWCAAGGENHGLGTERSPCWAQPLRRNPRLGEVGDEWLGSHRIMVLRDMENNRKTKNHRKMEVSWDLMMLDISGWWWLEHDFYVSIY